MSTSQLLKDFTKEKLIRELRRISESLNQTATATETGTKITLLYKWTVTDYEKLAALLNDMNKEISL